LRESGEVSKTAPLREGTVSVTVPGASSAVGEPSVVNRHLTMPGCAGSVLLSEIVN
jgi:precorrin-4 methylase